MQRRQFITFVSSALLWSSTTRAQQRSRKPLVVYLSGGTQESRAQLLVAFHRGMDALGSREGESYAFEARYADGNFNRLPALAAELLALDPDVFLVSTTPGNLATKKTITAKPIVMVAVADPIGVGLIASLSRPGGNITGITNIAAELAGKRLEILKELVPSARKIAVLINWDDPNARLQMNSAERTAKELGVELDPIIEINDAGDLRRGFEEAARAHAGAAMRMTDPLESALRRQTVALAAEFRLPTVYPFREAVDIGGLVSYGTGLPDQYRQAATFVMKILRGAKPADIPVEQPVKLELVINAKATKALGLTVPGTLIARADDVIE